MRILVTGNMGYVGPMVVAHLASCWPDAEIIGFDSGFFSHCLSNDAPVPEIVLARQHFGDVRDLSADVLKGVDAVVHLAAISNDPMGHRFGEPTEEINFKATARLCGLAAAAGVSRFVFASSCSVYGFADGQARREGDALNPLTAYARSKIASEKALAQIDAGGMVISCLRFATACGVSSRLRLDLVLNDFVASALLSGQIRVLSDGKPWRPLIDVSDMARAIEWALTRTEEEGGRFLAVNTGCDENTIQIAELAELVARAVPNTSVSINRDAQPDNRSYRVDFGLFRRLAPRHQPALSIAQSIARLRDDLLRDGSVDPQDVRRHGSRLATLTRHIEANRLSASLRWTHAGKAGQDPARDAAPAEPVQAANPAPSI